MKKVCTNCHFLGKQHKHQPHDEGVPFFLNDDERKSIQNGNVEFISEGYAIRCLKGVWDQRFYDKEISLSSVLNSKERNNKCFFYPYDEGLSFSAAEELQKRHQDHEQLRRSNRYTRIGLWVASGALMINAIIGIIKLWSCA